MSLIAAHINDAGISVLSAEGVIYREPGFALLEDDKLTTGLEAFASSRIRPRRIQNGYWANLTTEPLREQQFRHLSNADLVSQQLEDVWHKAAQKGDRLVVAVPAYMSNANLGLLLGIAGELNIPIAGMVDAAVAATRREYQDAVPVHVDISLQSTILSRLTQGGQASIERSQVIDESGMLILYDAWRKVVAEAFVQQSRFDPLHTAETEQVLQDNMLDWLATASTNALVPMEVEYRGIKHQAEIESLAIESAAAPVYQRIASNLRALYRADETPAIQMSDRAARMPGLAEMLLTRVGGETFLLEPGATARGLLTRCRDMQAGEGGISLVRQLPWDQAALQVAQSESKAQGGRPTHVLYENTAYAISDTAINIGSQPGEGRWIDLKDSMPGVSRRHCSVSYENGQCVVRDSSRYGSFLNGHVIDGSAVLQIGDSVRVGTPGFELRLIDVENADGS